MARLATSMELTQRTLEDNERINIEQDEDWTEWLTCGLFTKENVYHIFAHPVLSEQEEVITIQERSSMFCRVGCIFPRWRSFLVTMVAANNEELWFIYDKPFGYPFMKWNRPDFIVYDHDETAIGSIKSEWRLFKIVMTLKDPNGDPIYEIVGSMCTPGYCWEPCCNKCFAMKFKILDLRKDRYELARFKKDSSGCWKDLLLKSDKYSLEVPSVMTYHERILTCVAIHEIDMMYFERKIPFLW